MAIFVAPGIMLVSRAESPADLLTRLQAGEASAVAEAYELYHAEVRRLALRLLSDKASAEDLVHDVFIALHKNCSKFRGDCSLRTFLLSIAVNRSKHHIRGSSRRSAALSRYSDEPEPERPSGPESTAARKELADVLARCLDKLPEDQRIAFILCEVEQRDSREVSAIVEAPEGTVRTRLMHAKRKLRDMLGREGLP